jgi:putative SOS response-associated peptidase YedK
MCYFNGQKVTKEEFIRLKDLEKLVANYSFLNRDVVNGFDFGNTAVLKPIPGKTDFEIVEMEWGFLPDPLVWPFWETREQVFLGRRPHKDSRGNFQDGLNFLNAISGEILKNGKVYRKAALDRHCLFLSTGFYEWRHFYPLNKRTGEPRKTAEKYPYRITVKEREWFPITGVWQEWMDADTGEVLETCALATTNANPIMEQIHNNKKRMPTMLTDDLAWEWLFGERDEKRIQEIASFQMPWEELSYYTLAKDFLTSTDPLKEFVYPDLPPIITPGTEPPRTAIVQELF